MSFMSAFLCSDTEIKAEVPEAKKSDELLGLGSQHAVVWQVSVQEAPPKLLPVKPKLYLVCTLRIPASSCVNLSA